MLKKYDLKSRECIDVYVNLKWLYVAERPDNV